MNAIYSWVYDVKRHRCVLPRRSNLSQCREPSRGLICRKLDPFLLLIVISEQYRVLVGFIAFSDRVTLFFVELVLPWGECGQSILFCKYVYKEWLLLRELTVQQHQYVTHLGKCSHCPLISARVGHCGNESNHFLQKICLGMFIRSAIAAAALCILSPTDRFPSLAVRKYYFPVKIMKVLHQTGASGWQRVRPYHLVIHSNSATVKLLRLIRLSAKAC